MPPSARRREPFGRIREFGCNRAYRPDTPQSRANGGAGQVGRVPTRCRMHRRTHRPPHPRCHPDGAAPRKLPPAQQSAATEGSATQDANRPEARSGTILLFVASSGRRTARVHRQGSARSGGCVADTSVAAGCGAGAGLPGLLHRDDIGALTHSRTSPQQCDDISNPAPASTRGAR